MTDAAPSPIPAATLVVMRQGEDGAAPDLLFVERSRDLRFAGGAVVFPGGRIDPGDHALAERIAPGLSDAAARIAAIRETLEETGLAVGFATSPPPEAAARMRRGLNDGRAMGEVIEGALDLDALVPFARWRPDLPHARVFDTLFYLARCPACMGEVSVDGTENSRLFWARAQRVLDDAARGDVHIIYPTRRNLERLAARADFDAAIAHARDFPVRLITPWVEMRDGARHLCIPDDLGYPVTSEPLADVKRG
ncbi:NUDIX domain-containing protein [Stakelama sp. CBK3Z-3]|uniref:NUDIX domain-containing protein n=2 Tax=Stakelama flava TaxID=2860338 RepID=A0ABS6XMX8_9SPHN|nr:NUDIX domain-containing protein [Stakelama flava]MBW4331555.1 NUDIX domain-containing protein [Stakelama flava]